MPIFDETWKKKEDRKVLYKLLLTRAKNSSTRCHLETNFIQIYTVSKKHFKQRSRMRMTNKYRIVVVHTRVIGYIHNSRHVLKYVSSTMYGLKSFLQEHPHILNKKMCFSPESSSSSFEIITLIRIFAN